MDTFKRLYREINAKIADVKGILGHIQNREFRNHEVTSNAEVNEFKEIHRSVSYGSLTRSIISALQKSLGNRYAYEYRKIYREYLDITSLAYVAITKDRPFSIEIDRYTKYGCFIGYRTSSYF